MSRKKFRYPDPTYCSSIDAEPARERLIRAWPRGCRVQVNARGRLLNVRKHYGIDKPKAAPQLTTSEDPNG